MQEIDLHDTIDISKNNSKKIHITSQGIPVPEDSTNLCYIAADIFFSEFNIQERVNITINKKIPVGGGLGGGSSNASTILKGLSQLFDINPNNFKELINTIKTEHDISGNIWKPIRIALTGSEHGPDISNYATILGPKTCVERIKLFLDLNVD